MIRRPPRSTLFPSTTLSRSVHERRDTRFGDRADHAFGAAQVDPPHLRRLVARLEQPREVDHDVAAAEHRDRKSTRLNSSHANISYAVFCLKKKKKHRTSPSP